MRGELLVSVLSGAAAFLLVRVWSPPPRRLGPRVRPYTAAGRSAGGLVRSGPVEGGSGLEAAGRLLSSLFVSVAARVGGMLDRTGEEGLLRRLGQAGMFPGLTPREQLGRYRLGQLYNLMGWGFGSALLGFLLPWSTGRALAVIILGVVVGATRQRGRLESAIEDRRASMRIEIYTINQLLAMRARTGNGVTQAVAGLVERGTGQVIGELAEALRLQRTGVPVSKAFAAAAATTPEPYCARTYALLAIAEDRGVDLADGLLALASDVREARREAIKRNATKRRAAMLIPTIAILAPVMLLFVGAPLPRIVLGWQ